MKELLKVVVKKLFILSIIFNTIYSLADYGEAYVLSYFGTSPLTLDKITKLTIWICIIDIIMLLAGITITQGSDLIKNTKVETYLTNMITIRSKAKVYAEETNAEVWDAEDKTSKREEIYSEKYKLTKSSNQTDLIAKVDSKVNTGNGCECYDITTDALKDMGLDELASNSSNGDYVVVYDSSNYRNLEIIYVPGVEYKGTTYYTLSSLQESIDK